MNALTLHTLNDSKNKQKHITFILDLLINYTLSLQYLQNIITDTSLMLELITVSVFITYLNIIQKIIF